MKQKNGGINLAIGDIIVGVDIGTTKVATVVGEVNNFGQIEIISNTSYKCSGLKKGKIINEDEITLSLAKTIKDAEEETNLKINSANVIGTIPSISNPAFLNIDVNCLTKSFSANITCASIVKLALKLPTGSDTTVPFSNVILSGTISIKVFPSGISISFT